MSLLTFSLHLVAFVNNINKINNNIFDNMFLDENLESARGRDVPPAIAVEPLRDLASASASAREALRSWLGGNGGKAKGVDPFEATAYLPPEVVADRSRASEELREQLVLEDKFSLSTAEQTEQIEGTNPAAESIDDVYEDVLEVAKSHALSRDVGCTVTVAFHRSTTCPMLHQDNVEQRAFCTLLGRGTEWLADPESPKIAALISAVNSAQAEQDYATARVHKLKLETEAAFSRAEERETVLIRGSKWPGAESKAPLHRSPHLPKDGRQFRLIVKVDSGKGLPGKVQRRMHVHSRACQGGACGMHADPCGRKYTKPLKT